MTGITLLQTKLYNSITRAKRVCRTKATQKCRVAWDEVEELSSALSKVNRRAVIERKAAKALKDQSNRRDLEKLYESNAGAYCEFFPEMEACGEYDA